MRPSHGRSDIQAELPPDSRYRYFGEAGPETRWRPELIRFVAYWREKAPDSGVPPRAAIDPLDITDLLPRVWMTDVEHDPFRLRYRLIGTEVAKRIDIDPVRRHVDEVFPGFLNSPLEMEAKTVAHDNILALYDGPPIMASDPALYRVQRVTAPLEGSPANILIGFNLFYYIDKSY